MKYLIIMLILTILVVGCNDNSGIEPPTKINNPQPEIVGGGCAVSPQIENVDNQNINKRLLPEL